MWEEKWNNYLMYAAEHSVNYQREENWNGYLMYATFQRLT